MLHQAAKGCVEMAYAFLQDHVISVAIFTISVVIQGVGEETGEKLTL